MGFDFDDLEDQDPTAEVAWTDPASREFDIIVFGATGYTGHLCSMQLDALLAKGPEHTWAIAGRNEKKLKEVAVQCHTDPGIVLAETPEEIAAMCQRCRVLISTVGPYIELGEPVVAACVENRTHYIDVSGEHVWFRKMIDKYHEKAKENSTMIVFSAAQESAAYDIPVYKLVRKLGPLRRVRMYMFQYGSSSGGTAYTGVVGMSHMQDPDFFRMSRDPFLIGGQRKVGVRKEDHDSESVEQDPLFPSLWLFPFGHAVCQVRMVRRSCQLFDEHQSLRFGYGDNFQVMLRDAAPKQKAAEVSMSTQGKITDPSQAEAVAEAMKFAPAMGQVPERGLGSTLEARGMYHSDMYCVAEGESGKWAHVHHTGPDTYEITAICCVAGALCLVEELQVIQPQSRGGCVTPAYAFHGTTWINRVEAEPFPGTTHEKLVFEVVEGKPADEQLKAAMNGRSKRAMAGMARIQKGEVTRWA